MTRLEKAAVIKEITEKLENNSFFYLADATAMTVDQVNKFRRLCYRDGIEMKVVKNALAQKAMDSYPVERNYSALYGSLKGQTALLFTEVANVPARLMKEFRGKAGEKPVLKAAYIDTAVYIGDDQLEALSNIKSKEEMLGELIGLLQSPAKNLVSALKSGGSTIMGLLKAMEERAAVQE